MKSKILKEIKESVLSIDSKAEVILFGSRARGDETSDSDWDILILTTLNDIIGFEDNVRDDIFEIELKYSIAVSIFVFSKQNWDEKQKVTPFYSNVNRDSIEL